MARNYAIFICTDRPYLRFANVLLNSLEKHGNRSDVYVIHNNLNLPQYFEDANRLFSFRVIPIEISRADFQMDEQHNLPVNNNLFMKQARFRYIREHGQEYDVIGMFDADMYVASPNFINLFHLVEGTTKLIACNERYKWVFDRSYLLQDQPIFPSPVKALKFHCSVPIIFDMKHWLDVFDYYNQLAFNSYEIRENAQKRIGDIFCWNISVCKNNRQDDVVLFPMETMTQVHYTNSLPWTRMNRYQGTWYTYAGDEVFSIHGRIGNPKWLDDQVNHAVKANEEFGFKDPEKNVRDTRRVCELIRAEWTELNCNWMLRIQDYISDYDRY